MYFVISNNNIAIVEEITIVNSIQIENNSDKKLCEVFVGEFDKKCNENLALSQKSVSHLIVIMNYL